MTFITTLKKSSSATLVAIAIATPMSLLPVNTFAAGETETMGATKKCDSGMKWSLMAKKCIDAKSKAKTDTKSKTKAKKESAKVPTIKCFNKKIWDAKAKKCVAEEKSSSLDQDSIYFHARDLARAGQYENAIRVLYLAPDQADPRVLNYLGFSNRKLGNMDKALTYYHAAIASNPDFSLVREYLGEAYVQLGQLEKAREQLTQIERICGTQDCREYTMLTNYMVTNQLQ